MYGYKAMSETTTKNNQTEARMTRAIAILETKRIVRNSDGSFVVPSQTSQNVTYEVQDLGTIWVCSCPDFETREIQACKHIFAAKFWVAATAQLRQEKSVSVIPDNAIKCDKCGSVKVIKFGFDCGKQTYRCKDCKHKFREPSVLRNVKFSPELITLTLDLYFSGLSIRKVTRMVNDHFNIKVGNTTVYDWIQRYVPRISDYINSLKPELSETWHADELFVKMKNGQTVKGNSRIAFLWNVMDRETRFLITSTLTDERDKSNATKAFKEAVANAHGQLPTELRSDSLKSYSTAVSETMPNVNHKTNCGIRKTFANNNRIERMNGTLRERVKVQRGWKSMKSVISEGQRIQYNFVKPHQALGGLTPAKAAGIEPRGWSELLRSATDKERRTRTKTM